MNVFRTFLLPVFLIAATSLHATIYKGKIGDYPVFLELTSSVSEGKTVFEGAYFYESKCLDIRFEGKIAGNKYLLEAGVLYHYQKVDPELFTLIKVGKALSGTWEYRGKKLDVVLLEYNPAQTDNPFLRNPLVQAQNLSHFERIRTSFAEITKTDSVQKLENGVELAFYREKHSDSYVFRITKGLPAAEMTWANQFLEAEQLRSFSSYGTCGTGEFQDHFHPLVVNADFISYKENVYHDCGGPRPYYYTDFVNVSLADKHVIDTDELLQFPGFVRETEETYREYMAYRENAFAPRIVAYLKAEHPDEFPDRALSDPPKSGNYDDGFCHYEDPYFWHYGDVLITAEGFQISAHFDYYMSDCDDPEWAVIPYETLKEYLNPEYKEALLNLTK